MSLKWLIEQCTDQSAPYATLQEEAFLFVIDAALEYWLMKHKTLYLSHDHVSWSQYDGWQCDCLEDSDA